MKHTLKVTLIFVAIFIVSQLVGLYSLGLSSIGIVSVNGTTEVKYHDTAIGERPETEGLDSLIYILIGIAIGTVILLLFAKYQKVNWWRIWFFFAVFISLAISIGTYLMGLPFYVSWILAILLAYFKLFKPNAVLQNITEILMYAGITILLAPIFKGEMLIATAILVIMSVYDAWAVWKSKHMVKMAEFTTNARLFPGITISYSENEGKTVLHNKIEKRVVGEKADGDEGGKTGVLGGGDIVFPLIFSGTMMEYLVSSGRLASMAQAFFTVQIITITTAIMLFVLFYFSKKDRFYPAMPFVTTGCLAGYAIIMLII